MIDTWARHLAAVGEARRLILMVLDNNPAFLELARSPGQGLSVGGQTSGALAGDVHYKAYVHLNEALAALKLVPSIGEAVGGPAGVFSARIAEIAPAAPCRADVNVRDWQACGQEPDEENAALIRLRQRLAYVLGEPETEPIDAIAVVPELVASGEEARVAIVRLGMAAGSPAGPTGR